jgi:hypothetical protein
VATSLGQVVAAISPVRVVVGRSLALAAVAKSVTELR